jgi:hypothetical protein
VGCSAASRRSSLETPNSKLETAVTQSEASPLSKGATSRADQSADKSAHSKKTAAAAEPHRLQLSLLSRFKLSIYYAPSDQVGGGLMLKDSSLIPVERIERQFT